VPLPLLLLFLHSEGPSASRSFHFLFDSSSLSLPGERARSREGRPGRGQRECLSLFFSCLVLQEAIRVFIVDTGGNRRNTIVKNGRNQVFSPGRGADRGNEIEERRKQKNATRKKKPNSEKIISLSLPFSLLSHPHKVHPAPDLEQAKPKVDPEQLRDLQTKPEPEIRDVKRLDRGQPDDEAVGAGLCRGARWEAAAVGRGEVQVGLDPTVVGKELGEVRQQPAGGVRDDDADLGEGAPVPVDAKVEAGAEERRRDAEAEEDLDDGADRLALSEGAVLTWGVWRWGEGRSFFLCVWGGWVWRRRRE